MKKKENGFTLVELISVIIILIILTLVVITLTSRQIEKSNRNALVKTALTFQKAAQTKLSADKLDGKLSDNIYHDATYGKVCYSITDHLMGTYVRKQDSKLKGSIEVCYGIDCTYETKIWLTDGDYYVDGLTTIKDESELTESFSSTQYPESCGVKAIGGGTKGTYFTAEYDSEKKEQTFRVLIDGTYALEAWGASGGNYGAKLGAPGGYAYGEVNLKKGDILYINVGEQGHEPCSANNSSCVGSYGGGSKPGQYIGGGGGYTSIAKKSGPINKPVSKENLLLVAGGGSGGNDDAVFSGGGTCSGGYDNVSSQVCNGSIYGGYNPTDDNYYGNGGGYTSVNYTRAFNATSRTWGGNGYLGKVQNGVMYCKECYATNQTVSINTSNVSEDPISQYAKLNNGYAKVTLISNDTEETKGLLATDFPDYLRLDYIYSTGTQYIDTLVKASPSTKVNADIMWINCYPDGGAFYYAFGAASSNTSIGLNYGYYSYHINWCGSYGLAYNDGAFSDTGYSGACNCSANTKQNVKLNMKPGYLEINDGYTLNKNITTIPENTSAYNMYIFANNNAGSPNNYGQLRLYSMKIYEGNNLVRDFIPCYSKLTNDVGLCDMVSKEFYKNKGTDNLKKGPVNNT